MNDACARLTLETLARGFAATFPRFDFSVCRRHKGLSLAAMRRGGGAEPGLYAVITNDLAELRQVLEKDQEEARSVPG